MKPQQPSSSLAPCEAPLKASPEQSNKILSEISTILSHDLKSPLRAISTHCDLILNDFSPSLNEAVIKKLNRISELAESAEMLAADLLYYTKLEEMELTLEAVNLSDIIQEIMTAEGKNKDPKVTLTLSETIPTLICDRARIKDVFQKLIRNAITYNDCETKIIQIGWVSADSSPQKETCLFIKDNGIGIDPRYHDHIFQLSSRLHSKQEYGGGNGFGLACVKKNYSSTRGKDRRRIKGQGWFNVFISRWGARQMENLKGVMGSLGEASDKPILIIEDNDDDYEFALRGIEASDIRNPIFRCTDGQDGLDYLHCKGKFSHTPSPKPSVIILDLNIPKLNGRTLLKHIKSDIVLKRIPVIILTSSEEVSEVQDCYDLGANTYIKKPRTLSSFINVFKGLKDYWLRIATLPSLPQSH